ncbi:MAG TPA: squalene/phytoene synthase family protein, partial [Gammaproteobacteria bacterium]|nr:squalene/phytoene synthase family protein [Gammaproteobacteria bacterium]
MDPGYAARAAPPGSVAWLQLLFTPAAQRPVLQALFALRAEIRQAVRPQLEPAVARMRLGWWQEELVRLMRGQARHPVTQALARAGPGLADEFFCLNGLLDAAAQELARTAFADLDALGAYARASTSPVYRLAALAARMPARDPAALAAADVLGGGVRLAEIVRDVQVDALDERLFLPLSALEHDEACALVDGHAAPRMERALRDTHALAKSWLADARHLYQAVPPDPASAVALEWHSAALEA